MVAQITKEFMHRDPLIFLTESLNRRAIPPFVLDRFDIAEILLGDAEFDSTLENIPSRDTIIEARGTPLATWFFADAATLEKVHPPAHHIPSPITIAAHLLCAS